MLVYTGKTKLPFKELEEKIILTLQRFKKEVDKLPVV